MKPILTLDLDNTVLNTGREYVQPEKRTYTEFVLRYKGEFPGAYELCLKYRVYFLSSRGFPGAFDLSVRQIAALPCEGLITGVEHQDKERVSVALGSIAHIDDDWRVPQSMHTMLVNVWDDCPDNLDNHIFEGLDDPKLIRTLEARWKIRNNIDNQERL